METSEERRQRRLIELIDLEGGPKRKDGRPPGHYVIAERVVHHEGSADDHTQMAQSLRQVVNGKRTLGPESVRRIEEAYQALQLYGIRRGWFDASDATSVSRSSYASALPSTPLVVNDHGPSDRSRSAIVASLRLSMPADLHRNLAHPTTFLHSYADSSMTFHSGAVSVYALPWRSPTAADDDGHSYVSRYPASIIRAVLLLAAHRVDGAYAPLHRHVVAVITGPNAPASPPLDLAHQASRVGVELRHFETTDDLAVNIVRWQKLAEEK